MSEIFSENYILDKNQLQNYLENLYPGIINAKLFNQFTEHKLLKNKIIIHGKRPYFYKKDIDRVIKKWLTPTIYKYNLESNYNCNDEHNLTIYYKSKLKNYKNMDIEKKLNDIGIFSEYQPESTLI